MSIRSDQRRYTTAAVGKKAATTYRKATRSGRRVFSIILGSLLAVIGTASPADAATYRMSGVRYNSNCGVSNSSMNSVFTANASTDGTTKVDFLDLKQSARIYLPTACPIATKICLDARITAHTKGGIFSSSGTFGAWGDLWHTYREYRSGNMARASGSKCMSIYARSATITAYADANFANFVWTGGGYKLADYKYQTRVRWYGGGAWHYGSWASFYKAM
jgi:hypothetical protein